MELLDYPNKQHKNIISINAPFDLISKFRLVIPSSFLVAIKDIYNSVYPPTIMFKFPTITILTALASIGAVAASSISSNAPDPRFVASVVVQHYRNLDSTPTAIASTGSIRSTEKECADVLDFATFTPSEAAMKELEDWSKEVAAVLEAGPTTLSLDFSEMPTYLEEYQKACTEAGGDNYLISISTEGCDLLSGTIAAGFGGGGGQSLDINVEIKNSPACLGNCPNTENYADALAVLDPTCKDAFSMKSGANAMAGSVFLGIGALVATFTMLIM